jgi:hypothetical protein
MKLKIKKLFTLIILSTFLSNSSQADVMYSPIYPMTQFLDYITNEKTQLKSSQKVLVPNLPIANENADLGKGLHIGEAVSFLLDYQSCKEGGQSCNLLTTKDLIVPESLNEFLDPENFFQAIPKSFAPNIKSNLFSIIENVVEKRTPVFRRNNCKRNTNLFMIYSNGIASTATSNYGTDVPTFAMYKNIPRYQNDLFLSFKRLLNSEEGMDLLQKDNQLFNRLSTFSKNLRFLKKNLTPNDLLAVREIMNNFSTFYQYVWSKKECQEEYLNIKSKLSAFPKTGQNIEFNDAVKFLMRKIKEGKAVGLNSICLRVSQEKPYHCLRYGSMIITGFDIGNDPQGASRTLLQVSGHGMEEIQSIFYPLKKINFHPFWISIDALTLILFNPFRDDLIDSFVPANSFVWFE